MSKQIELLRARRFLPLLMTQTTGAFNDNLFKSAFIMLITYGAAAGPDPGVVAAIAGGALIAPFFLFSATAGELADRFERSRLLQILKAAELVAVFGAAAALLTGDLALSLALLFVLGTQAAFSSPLKYALLPQHLAALRQAHLLLALHLVAVLRGVTQPPPLHQVPVLHGAQRHIVLGAEDAVGTCPDDGVAGGVAHRVAAEGAAVGHRLSPL